MVTRMKVSAVKRRVKRRSERKSRHNKKANLVRSRKQRGRNTARKVMRGGEHETIQISIHGQYGKLQENAVTLKLSDKLMSKNKKLLMSVDLNKFKGDVRNLLNKLFTIDGFNRDTTHSRTNFLVGLADEPAREGVTQWANEYVNRYCNDNNPNINFNDRNNDKVRTEMDRLIDETLLPTKTCDIEIELFENNGDITFTVQNYHRMKIRNIQRDCNQYTKIEEKYNHGIVDENGNSRVTRIPHITTYKNQYLFYPKLEFASANPDIGGIDYFDYEAAKRNDDSEVTVYDKKDQTFTFTVKSKTIDDLKKELRTKTELKETDMLYLTTQEKETQEKETRAVKNTPHILKKVEFVDETKSDEEALKELDELIKAGEALYTYIRDMDSIVTELNKNDYGILSSSRFKDIESWTKILEETKNRLLKKRDDKQLLNLDNAVVKLVELKKLLAKKINFNPNYQFYREPLQKFLKDEKLLEDEEPLKYYEKLDLLFSLVWRTKIGLENYKKTEASSSIFENIEAYKIIFPYSEYVVYDTRD